ncbi:family 43 glycosylhydrolase [Leucobacter sp.]
MRLWKHLCALVLASGLVVGSTAGVAGPAFAEGRDTAAAESFGDASGDGQNDAPGLPGAEDPEPQTGTGDSAGAGTGEDASEAADPDPGVDPGADGGVPDADPARSSANASETAGDAPEPEPAEDRSAPVAAESDPGPILAASSLCAAHKTWMRPGCPYTGTFADPTILPVREGGKTVYYAFGTTTSQLRLPVLRSTDLKHWYPAAYSSQPGWDERNFNFSTKPWNADYDKMYSNPGYYDPRADTAIPSEIRGFTYQTPRGTASARFMQERETWFNGDGLVSPRPKWAHDMGLKMGNRGWNRQENWAPGVAHFNGRYHAYMSLRVKPAGAAGAAPDGAFCIVLATSSKPGGPYRYANGGDAIQCQPSDPGGAIDPEPVQYGGKWYLLWKGQGRGGVEQGLYAQPINTATGKLTGSRVTLLTRSMSSGTWEIGTIENPTMRVIGGTAYLLYSGGNYQASAGNTSNYATGYAVCPKGPTAPCKRPAGDNRLLRSSGKVQGPAGGSLFTAADGSVKYAYHAYELGGSPGVRNMRVTNLYRLGNGRLVLTDGPKPIFGDVPGDHQFAKQIKWLADRGITTGDRAGNFRPKANVSRSDMAAFLYRYAGSPRYTPSGPEPFADVRPGQKFYREIRWMHAEGLSTGVRNPGGKPLYKPSSSISREAMAAFLYRLSGLRGYTPKGGEPLADVNRSSRFYREIRWMYDIGITTGIDAGGGKVRYDALGTTKRDAFAAFLMRYDGKF